MERRDAEHDGGREDGRAAGEAPPESPLDGLPGEPAAPLAEREREQAEERSSVGPRVVHEAIRIEGEEELARPAMALVWSGLAAGMSMGFSLVGEALLRAALPDAPWRPLVAKLGYTLGFLFVVLGRQQLFTENTLTVILPVMRALTPRNLLRVARVWALVLSSNLAGAFLFAWSLTIPEGFSAANHRAFEEIAHATLDAPFSAHLLRGVYGGWLIALMVWLLPAARNARFFVVVTVTWLVGVGAFTHAIAGSVDVLYLVARGEISPGRYLGGFLLPAFLGNTLGGVSLVAAINHAQVVAGLPRRATSG